MREVALASKWVKQGPSKPLYLMQADGTPASTPREQDEAIRRAWLPHWTEAQSAKHEVRTLAATTPVQFRVSAFPSPRPWTVPDVRAQVRKSAAGLDGSLSFHQFGSLADEHLHRLAMFTAFDQIPCLVGSRSVGAHCQREDGSASFGFSG